MDKLVVVFTMEGCPFCDIMKDKLDEMKLPYLNRDISEHSDEYNLFVEVTGSEFVPAFMIIENIKDVTNTKAYVPDRDYKTIDEGVQIIKKVLS